MTCVCVKNLPVFETKNRHDLEGFQLSNESGGNFRCGTVRAARRVVRHDQFTKNRGSRLAC